MDRDGLSHIPKTRPNGCTEIAHDGTIMIENATAPKTFE